MPKQILEINPFHGGLNSQGDPRDIKVEELSLAQDIMVDEIGKIRTMGSNIAHDAPTLNSTSITPGYGLHYMSHDMTKAELTEANAVEAAETGDDYLFMANKADCTIDVYSAENDTWGADKIDLGAPTGSEPDLKAAYYNVDGALRVSDGSFGTLNRNKWYGYIKRKLFQDSLQQDIDQWYATSAKIKKPSHLSRFDNAVASVGTQFGTNTTFSNQNTDDWFKNQDQIYEQTDAQGDDFINVAKFRVTFEYSLEEGASDTDIQFDFKIGKADDSSTFNSSEVLTYEATYQKDGSNWGTGIGSNTFQASMTYSFPVVATNFGVNAGSESEIGIVDNQTTKGVRALISNESLGADVSSLHIEVVQLWQAIASIAEHDLESEDVYVEVVFGTASEGTGVGWDKKWNFGVTFIYDEKQESLIRELYDKDDADSYVMDVTNTAHCPDLKISIKYDNADSIWNKRITGINFYMREQDEAQKTDWYLQTKYDLVKGVGSGYPNGVDVDFLYDGDISEYSCLIAREDLLTPNLIGSFETITGISADEKSIESKFSTAVVANRVAYIGNVQLQNEDGTKETRADGMLKSNVNQFDVFPSNRIIEASVRDGDEIVKLEEYADRILQFKKHKMHIINISQEIEFLEDTHMHKGIKHPASVAKTDYGVVWANEEGCYLYDGKQIHDLLEKDGLQIIKESDWATHIGTNPMVGYIPKKRQVVIVRTAGSGGLGDVYLYDLVTRSWVRGDSKFDDSNVKSNFIVDWNGDLAHAKTSAGNVSFKKWDDTSAIAGSLLFQTKDMTFGQAGQRKKLHKIYITYKGDARLVTCKYAVDGESDVGEYKQFNSDDTPLEDKSSETDWTLAELKPTNSADATNIYSSKFYLAGSSVPADFEINDINVVFRMKNVK